MHLINEDLIVTVLLISNLILLDPPVQSCFTSYSYYS